MFRLSTKSAVSSHSTATPMVLANSTLDTVTCGLSCSDGGEDVIDAHSKWIEVFPMAAVTALTTIQRLGQLFSQFGIPKPIVLDNGPQFAAAEFREFCLSNGIRHIRVASYQPSSNGLAERAVQVFKQGLQKSSMGTQSDRIARFCSSTESHHIQPLVFYLLKCCWAGTSA